jgi:SAM-dependent methyltransferase
MTMALFEAYANYYNLLYSDKDYAAEADHVHALLKKYAPATRSMLDLGCGTGGHDLLLAQKGFTVTGVDRSAEMLAMANARLANLVPQPAGVSFIQDDIRTLCLNQTFDAVLSLFHVISYQTSNEDLQAAFATVRKHLAPGGIFIFDCWYGPAVLTDRPCHRTKRLENETIAVTRDAEPELLPNDNQVAVHYRLLVSDKATGAVEELHETHRMRYLFRPELELFLHEAGMNIIEAREWMTGKPSGCDTWGVCFVVQG